MEDLVNFQLEVEGKIYHCFSLQVTCQKVFKCSNEISYSVDALAYLMDVPKRISPLYDTLEEAFEFMERIVKKYPRYNDDRDYSIEYSPEFDIKEVEFIENK